jgi:hypothetical protein
MVFHWEFWKNGKYYDKVHERLLPFLQNLQPSPDNNTPLVAIARELANSNEIPRYEKYIQHMIKVYCISYSLNTSSIQSIYFNTEPPYLNPFFLNRNDQMTYVKFATTASGHVYFILSKTTGYYKYRVQNKRTTGDRFYYKYLIESPFTISDVNTCLEIIFSGCYLGGRITPDDLCRLVLDLPKKFAHLFLMTFFSYFYIPFQNSSHSIVPAIYSNPLNRERFLEMTVTNRYISYIMTPREKNTFTWIVLQHFMDNRDKKLKIVRSLHKLSLRCIYSAIIKLPDSIYHDLEVLCSILPDYYLFANDLDFNL